MSGIYRVRQRFNTPDGVIEFRSHHYHGVLLLMAKDRHVLRCEVVKVTDFFLGMRKVLDSDLFTQTGFNGSGSRRFEPVPESDLWADTRTAQYAWLHQEIDLRTYKAVGVFLILVLDDPAKPDYERSIYAVGDYSTLHPKWP